MPDPTRPIESEYRRELARANAERRTAERERDEARQRAGRYERAIREVGERIDFQVGTADDTYVIAVPVGMLREWRQTLEAALAADPQPVEAGGEEG